MNNKLGKGIIAVFLANIINLIFNLISNFALPKYLSVESYAAIKSFTLYLSYAGFLHFGYEDGMYLKYGGQEKKDISYNELSLNMSTLRIFQAVISILIFVVAFGLHDDILFFFGLALLPYNMMYYFRNLFQAIGEFKLYGKVLNLTTVMLFILNMTLLFIVKTQDYIYYLMANVLVYVLTWIFIELYIRKTSNFRFSLFDFSIYEFISNIKTGFLLMLGTFASILLTSMDRWFVKAFLDNIAFAQYSFAVSIENFLNVAITPITVTLYNYFCKTKDVDEINKLKRYIIIFSVIVVACAFPAKFILEVWLTNYLNSVIVVFLLFASRIFFTINTSIYVNLYKAHKMQRKYFFKLVFVIIFGLVSNAIIFAVFRVKEAFAIATLLSAILWQTLSLMDFKEFRFYINEIVFLIVETTVFIVTGIFCSSLAGFAIYVLVTIATCFILMRKDVLGIASLMHNYYRMKLKK